MAKITINDTHSVTLTRDDGGVPLVLKAAVEKNKACVDVILNGSIQTFWREDFLNAVVALYPDNVAYQFTEEEEEEQ